MKKLLWVGDAGCPSGFAVATHGVLATLKDHYDVTVLGMNFNGDADTRDRYPYPIYLAGVGGDGMGVRRLAWMCAKVRPDVVVVQNDGWNVPAYVHALRERLPSGEFRYPDFAGIPIVACVAVDGKNFNREWLRGVDLAIFWTQFALDEAYEGGWRGESAVIPLGVDLDVYKPLDRLWARRTWGPMSGVADVLGNEKNFIVGNVNRNQPRKRWDLTIKYFAQWLIEKNVNDAWLYMHAAPTGDASVNIIDLARYYGCLDRTILSEPPVFYGLSEEQMCLVYNCLDLLISTTQGEGMGLPAMEAMACEVPCLLPDWSAYGSWAKGAAMLVPCTTTRVDFPYVNVIGGVPDERAFIDALDLLYRDHAERQRVAVAGTLRVRESRFRWEGIAARYVEAIDALLETKVAEKAALDSAVAAQDALPTAEDLLERRLKVLRGEVVA